MVLAKTFIMQLDSEAIEEFKDMYFREYGIKLTDQQAIDYGSRLIGFVKAVYGNDLPKRIDIDKNTK